MGGSFALDTRVSLDRLFPHAMSSAQVKTADYVYRFLERLKSECQKSGATELFAQLGGARHLGSPGLEMLEGIRQTLIDNRPLIGRLMGPSGKAQAGHVIAFVDKAFGA